MNIHVTDHSVPPRQFSSTSHYLEGTRTYLHHVCLITDRYRRDQGDGGSNIRPPLVLGTVISLADHPGIYAAQGEGERGGKAPPPLPPIGPPPGIPTVITCPEGATEEKVKGYKPLLVSVSTSRC